MSTSDPVSPAELEKQVEADRLNLHRTLDQLRDNMKPARMAGEILTTVMGRRYDRPLASGRPKTVPESLVDLGAAVLFGSSLRALKRVDDSESTTGPNADSVRTGLHAVGTEAEAAHARIVNQLDRADARANTAAAKIATSVKGLRMQATEESRLSKGFLTDLGAKANDAAARHAVTANVTRLVAQKPFMLGAIGAAIGAAVGVSLAMTQTEDELMGTTSVSVRKAARAMARERYEQLKQVTSQTIDDLKQTVVDHST